MPGAEGLRPCHPCTRRRLPPIEHRAVVVLGEIVERDLDQAPLMNSRIFNAEGLRRFDVGLLLGLANYRLGGAFDANFVWLHPFRDVLLRDDRRQSGLVISRGLLNSRGQELLARSTRLSRVGSSRRF